MAVVLVGTGLGAGAATKCLRRGLAAVLCDGLTAVAVGLFLVGGYLVTAAYLPGGVATAFGSLLAFGVGTCYVAAALAAIELANRLRSKAARKG